MEYGDLISRQLMQDGGGRMSVLIMGVEMPTECGKCFVGDRSICKDGCPLVDVPTPHGRLIDADELKRNTMFIFSGTIREREIDEATTIIEAGE